MAIESRDALILDSGGANNIVAWRDVGSAKWPVLCLDEDLHVNKNDDNWQRVVFVAASPVPVGLAAQEVQLINNADLTTEPFTPVGMSPTKFGHLFKSAWVDAGKPYPVFSADALGAYLHGCGA